MDFPLTADHRPAGREPREWRAKVPAEPSLEQVYLAFALTGAKGISASGQSYHQFSYFGKPTGALVEESVFEVR